MGSCVPEESNLPGVRIRSARTATPAWRVTRWRGLYQNWTVAASQIVTIESAWRGRKAQFADPDKGSAAVSQFGGHRKSLSSSPSLWSNLCHIQQRAPFPGASWNRFPGQTRRASSARCDFRGFRPPLGCQRSWREESGWATPRRLSSPSVSSNLRGRPLTAQLCGIALSRTPVSFRSPGKHHGGSNIAHPPDPVRLPSLLFQLISAQFRTTMGGSLAWSGDRNVSCAMHWGILFASRGLFESVETQSWSLG